MEYAEETVLLGLSALTYRQFDDRAASRTL